MKVFAVDGTVHHNYPVIPRQHVSMHDVAQRAGVSPATVSRALRGLPGVAEPTRRRVISAAEALSYVVSPVAAALASGATGQVAVLVPRLESWYHAAVVAGAEEGLRPAGLDLLLHRLASPREQFDFFEHLPLRRKVDAVLVAGFALDTRAQSRLCALGLPVVLVGNRAESFASVRIDDRHAARQAVEHLIRAGHRRIAMISSQAGAGVSSAADTDRVEGYRQAHAGAGLPLDDALIVAQPWGSQGGADGMEHLLSLRHPPTAVFCFSDEVAFGALRTLRRAGLTVPWAMSVVAIDDHPMSQWLDLTTIRQSGFEQGVTAAGMVRRLLTGGAVTDVVLPTRLVVRHSTTRLPPEQA